MIRPTLSKRNKNGQADPFRIITIKLVNSEGVQCGIVKYVRLGKENDILDEMIFDCITKKYHFSNWKKESCYDTSVPFTQFEPYEKVDRLFISIKNNTKKDYGYELDNIDSMLAIFLDVYDSTETFVHNEIEQYARRELPEMSNAANEIANNLETYNTFIQ